MHVESKDDYCRLAHCNCLVYYKGRPLMLAAKKFGDRFLDPGGLSIVKPDGWFEASFDDIALYYDNMKIDYVSLGEP